MIGVDELYSRDFEEIIDQCLDRIALNNDKLPVRLVRRGLLVNRESHTIPERRRSTQALLDNIKLLGERNDEVKKKSFKYWIFKQFEKHQIEYLQNLKYDLNKGGRDTRSSVAAMSTSSSSFARSMRTSTQPE